MPKYPLEPILVCTSSPGIAFFRRSLFSRRFSPFPCCAERLSYTSPRRFPRSSSHPHLKLDALWSPRPPEAGFRLRPRALRLPPHSSFHPFLRSCAFGEQGPFLSNTPCESQGFLSPPDFLCDHSSSKSTEKCPTFPFPGVRAKTPFQRIFPL